MLASRRGNDNKVFLGPFAACRDGSGERWVVTGWEPCVRTWANAPCPCLHSDPKFSDCGPGETVRVKTPKGLRELEIVNVKFEAMG